MSTRLTDEMDLLKTEFRKKIIDEITGPENLGRKREELKKYEVYRDKTKRWVIDSLLREFTSETVSQMQNRAANVSIARKIVDKLAQCYNNGVIRSVNDPISKQKIELLATELDFDSQMRKVDRIQQLHRNCMVQVVPEVNYQESTPDAQKYDLCVRPHRPHSYDVIEDSRYRERARVVILTDFVQRKDGWDAAGSVSGDGRDQTIANSPSDAGSQMQTFIWWSDMFHFTTDNKGEILTDYSPQDNLNPIKMLPFVNFATDQDGQFWAEGGSDLVDGSILINVLLTDMFGIANHQGWGQLVLTGKGLPQVVQTGPHKAILMEHDIGDPNPTAQYITAAAPFDGWMRMIEQYVALLLSTNNLSPGNIAGKLDASQFPSGIAMMIERAESTADIQDSQRVFKDNEPVLWELVKRWYDKYSDAKSLTRNFDSIGKFTSSDVKPQFVNPSQVIGEKERLETIQLRQELGINTQIDLIKMDNPDLSDAEAEAKLLKILQERIKLGIVQAQARSSANPPPPGQPGASPDGIPPESFPTSEFSAGPAFRKNIV